MRLYNTLTRKEEEFVSNEPNVVKMYTCGPTVYHYAHIGNLRSYIMEDVLEKSFEFLGYKVKRVMNITDVGHLVSDADTGEDKMVKGAKREHKSVMDIAKFYTDAFFLDCSKLNIRKPSIIIPATSMINEYINMIEILLNKKYAYKAGDNIYFDTSKLNDYYALTNHNAEDLFEGVRDDVDVDTNKRNKTDFVLWFTKSKFEDQQLKWESPWGLGYPGWHIECSCIALDHLGEYLDIHCGGVDNIFPHHTNEIAQSEAFLGHKWCNYWFHVAYLNDETGKMSKSKGEFLTVSLLEEKGYDPLAYRLLCLSSHYRNPVLFTWENLESFAKTLDKLKTRVLSLKDDGDVANVEEYINSFKSAIENDLNTSMMITCLYDVLKSDLNDSSKKYLITEFDKVLGLDLMKETVKESSVSEEYIKSKIEARDIAKKNKDFTLADSIRDELLKDGIKLIDTKDGTKYEVM